MLQPYYLHKLIYLLYIFIKNRHTDLSKLNFSTLIYVHHANFTKCKLIKVNEKVRIAKIKVDFFID